MFLIILMHEMPELIPFRSQAFIFIFLSSFILTFICFINLELCNSDRIRHLALRLCAAWCFYYFNVIKKDPGGGIVLESST